MNELIFNNLIDILFFLKEKQLYRQLLDLTEENISHNGENILEHTLFVFTEALKYFKSSKGQSMILNQNIDNLSRRVMFLITVLLHDIGKIGYGEQSIGKVLLNKDGKNTSAKNHEVASVFYFTKHQSFFNFSPKQNLYIKILIRLHSGVQNDYIPEINNYQSSRNNWIKFPLTYEMLLFQLIENRHVPSFRNTGVRIEQLLKDVELSKYWRKLDILEKLPKKVNNLLTTTENFSDNTKLINEIEYYANTGK